MARFAIGLVLLAVVLVAGCSKSPSPPPVVEAGPGNWARLGPIGLSVESVRVGRIRMSAMLGRAGESKDEIYQIRTRFRLFDPSVVVKQPALQRDGSIIMGGGGMTLKDSAGTLYKAMGGFGFDAIKGRRSEAAELTADKPEATDLLTFEATAAKADELLLTIPASWQEKQPDGKFLGKLNQGSFQFKIPRAMVSSGPQPLEATPDNWYRIGPVGVSVTSVRFGKVAMEGGGPFGGKGESQESLLSVGVKFRLFDPKVAVKKAPFVPDGGFAFSSPMVVLDDTKGTRFQSMIGWGFNKIAGRQSGEVELSEKQPEIADLLTFDGKAGAADELILTLWPNWQVLVDGKWTTPEVDDEFRFRLRRAQWAK